MREGTSADQSSRLCMGFGTGSGRSQNAQIIVVWTRLIPFGFTSENNEYKLVLVKITVANYLFRHLCTLTSPYPSFNEAGVNEYCLNRSPRCALLVSCAFNFAPRVARSTRRINEMATLCSSAFLIATIFVRHTHFLHSPARWHPRLGHSGERDARHSLFLNYLLVDPVSGAATVTSFTGRRPCFKAGVARLHNVAATWLTLDFPIASFPRREL
ncbi:hypothetical protein T10_78 [Trichinella papuae]|uniref:Uncharacterized protein n=1 Tax=Trichinella papuae TaxID=268474 RepID=A0A0V1MPU4_9BILA|nr:hypothetical protein T10_78 [Trichinella papuae]